MAEKTIEEITRDVQASSNALKKEAATMTVPVQANNNTTWTKDTVWFLSGSFLIFTLVIFVLITYLLKMGKDPELLLRVFAVPLIIVASVVLVIAGYTEVQIAPVIGLLGTLAGYILGKNSRTPTSQVTPSQPPIVGV